MGTHRNVCTFPDYGVLVRGYTKIDALVACANTEDHAMELATMYERGEIEPTDFRCKKCGGNHQVLQEREE